MIYIWLAIIVLLAVIEFINRYVITLFYVISGVLALLSSFYTENYIIQLCIFIILGTVLLIAFRRPLRLKLKKNEVSK